MLESLLPSFSDEMQKLADDGSWREFEKNLKSPAFQRQALASTEDPKLKKYIKNVGGVMTSKDLKAFVQSASNLSKEHQVKVLSGGRLACTCKDWQYSHSVKNTDCKHVKRYRQYLQGLVGERRES